MMTKVNNSLVEFLLARIEEDEASARAAVGNDGPPTWLQDNADGVYGVRPDVDWDEVCQSHTYGVPNECDFNPTACGVSGTDDPVLDHVRAEHIARHDPARILAECAAKRQVISIVASWRQYRQRQVLQPLASVYADHPDCRDEWRPSVDLRT